MKYCVREGFRYPDEATKCRSCDDPLVDITTVKDLPENTGVNPTTLCCPNRECVALMAMSAKSKFCDDCGAKLHPISYELWVEKFVRPALEKRPAEVLLDPSDLFKPVAQMGLSRIEARGRLDALLEERTGVSRQVLNGWIEETSNLLKDEHKFEAAQQHAVRQAKKLNIAFLDAAVILELLARRHNISFEVAPPDRPIEKALPEEEPVVEARPIIDTAAKRKARIYKLKKKEFTLEDDELYPLLGGARSFYRNLVSGGSVSPNLTYLSLEANKTPGGSNDGAEIYLKEVKDVDGAFILFSDDDGSGWIFPNPRRTGVRADVKTVFPHLTQAEFEHARAYISPVFVNRVSSKRWRIKFDGPSTPEAVQIETPTDTRTPGGEEPLPTSPEQPKVPETASREESSSSPTEETSSSPTTPPVMPVPSKFRMTLLALGIATALIIGWLMLPKSPKQTPNNAGDDSLAGQPVPPGMVYVPGGEFTMGNNAGANELEKPEHSVRLAPFFIDQYEVTCEQYAMFVKATGHRTPSGWQSEICPPGADKLPVRGVSWNDATAYARWMDRRLPTEEEWELAARGYGKRRYPWNKHRYPWGDVWKPNAANAGETSAGQAVKVGSYVDGASPFKAYDMVGNVWEWTANNLTSYEPGKPLPKLLDNNQPVVQGKVIRGGSWESGQGDAATTTFRTGYPAEGKNYSKTGFRCAMDGPRQ